MATGENPSRKRILIVDDDASIRQMLSRVLQEEDYEVLTAAQGVEGLRMAAEHGADLVLLDLKMPGMNGLEVLRELKARRGDVPVIVITAYGRRPPDGGVAGAGAWLQKPLDFPTLLETIRKLLAEAAACK